VENLKIRRTSFYEMDYHYDVIISLPDNFLGDDHDHINIHLESTAEHITNILLFQFLPSDTLRYLQNPSCPGQPADLPQPMDIQYFPFELAKFFPPQRILEENESGENMGAEDPVSQIRGLPQDDNMVLPMTQYQPHYRRHKRTLVYEKHMSSFSTVVPQGEGLSVENNNMGIKDQNENEVLIKLENSKMEISTIQNLGGNNLNVKENIKDKKEENIKEKKEEFPQAREMLFEFTDTNLELRLNSDINFCSKSRNINRKFQWKKK